MRQRRFSLRAVNAPQLTNHVGKTHTVSGVECIERRVNAGIFCVRQSREFIDRGNSVPAGRKVTKLIREPAPIPRDDLWVHGHSLGLIGLYQFVLAEMIQNLWFAVTQPSQRVS